MLDLEDAWIAGQDLPACVDTALAAAPRHPYPATCGLPVDCLLVLDIEGGANNRPGEDEIIELPVVLIDLRTASEEARFHRFVRPCSWDHLLQPEANAAARLRRNPQASAVPFQQALAELRAWLRRHDILLDGIHEQDADTAAQEDAMEQLQRPRSQQRLGGGRSFLWVTCGDWDLKTIIPRQCAKSRVPVPPCMQSWCNLKVDRTRE